MSLPEIRGVLDDALSEFYVKSIPFLEGLL